MVGDHVTIFDWAAISNKDGPVTYTIASEPMLHSKPLASCLAYLHAMEWDHC